MHDCVLAISRDGAQYLLSTIAQCAATMTVLVLTARIISAQIAKYRLPLRFVLAPSVPEFLVWLIFLASIIAPVIALLSENYQTSRWAVLVFIVAVVLLIPYAIYQAYAVSVGRFVSFMSRKRGQGTPDDEDDLFDVCRQAVVNKDLPLIRSSALTLSQLAPGLQKQSTIHNRINRLLMQATGDLETFKTLLSVIVDYSAPFARTSPLGHAGLFERRRKRMALEKAETGDVPPALERVILRPNDLYDRNILNATAGTFLQLLESGIYGNQRATEEVARALLTIVTDHYLYHECIDKLHLSRNWIDGMHNVHMLLDDLAAVPPHVLDSCLAASPGGCGLGIYLLGNVTAAYEKRFRENQAEAKRLKGIAWNNFIPELVKLHRQRYNLGPVRVPFFDEQTGTYKAQEL